MNSSYEGFDRWDVIKLGERLHDPWGAAPRALEACAAGLAAAAGRIAEELARTLEGGPGHPQVIWGSWGSGKSHLAALVASRLKRRDGLAGQLAVYRAGEDAALFGGPLDLFLLLVREAARESGDPALVGRIASLYDLPPGAAEKGAQALLESLLAGRPTLLVVERLDRLTRIWGEEARGRWEEWLTRSKRLALLATADTPFDDDAGALVEIDGVAADIHGLRDLEPEELASITARVLGSGPDSRDARALAIAITWLTGTSRRAVAAVLEAVSVRGTAHPIDALHRVLQRLAPDFRARLAMASPQQHQILAALARARRALRVKELARACFLSSQTVSSQLAILKQRAFVVSQPLGRETWYDIEDPALGTWLESVSGTDEALEVELHFFRAAGNADDEGVGEVGALLEDDPSTWRSRVPDLIRRYRDAMTLGRLGPQLVTETQALREPPLDAAKCSTWRDLWWEWGGRESELLPALRLVDAEAHRLADGGARALLDLSRPLRRFRLEAPVTRKAN